MQPWFPAGMYPYMYINSMLALAWLDQRLSQAYGVIQCLQLFLTMMFSGITGHRFLGPASYTVGWSQGS